MQSEAAAVLSKALELAPQDRQQLAESLWESLKLEQDLPEVTDIDFTSETAQRRAEITSGAVSTISHQELKHQLGR